MPSSSGRQSLWIHSARDDLIWFQGSVGAGLLLLAFFVLIGDVQGGYAAGYPLLVMVFLWGTLFDGTHVWATYARTYFAPDSGSRAQVPGSWSWLVLLAGPTMAIIAWKTAIPALFQFFLLAAYLWAYWHLVRQHYGFLMLYRRRAGETGARGARLDELVLWSGCLYPFLRFSLGNAYAQSGLPQLVPAELLADGRIALDMAICVLAIGFVAIVLSQRVEKLTLGPKHLLMVLVISFHILVFSLLHNLLAILATLTIFHNIQYHRIVWMYERGLGRIPSGGALRFIGLGLVLGLLWYGLRVFGVNRLGPSLAGNALMGFCWGIAFHHYLLDSRIWRPSRSAAVSRALSVPVQ
jgi:hypothetical protein